MSRAGFFLQLTLFVATVHAFFPWIPPNHCGDGPSCHEAKETVNGRSVTYELVQRAPSSNVDHAVQAGKAASRLSRKYASSNSWGTRQLADLTRRGNDYPVVAPAAPSGPSSAGVYQDGTDFSYFLKAGIGSDGKQLYMLLDTGAGTTWVMGSSCQSSACTAHNSFGPGDSKSYQKAPKSFSIAYGSGSVSGELATDAISLAGMKVSMTFGVANTTSDDFNHFPFDGILGLSRSHGATDNFLQVVKDTKALSSNVFGVSLSRNSDGSNTGEITFGGVDSSKYVGSVSYTPIAPNGDWALPMDDLAYNGKPAGITGKIAYIDTGTSYVFGPPTEVAALHKLIPGAASADGVTYTVPCKSGLPISVSFSGVSYTISPKDWLSAPAGGGDTCTSNIYGYAVVQDAWLLGDLFLKNVYAVFDSDQVRMGLAAKSTAGVAPLSATAPVNPSAQPTTVAGGTIVGASTITGTGTPAGATGAPGAASTVSTMTTAKPAGASAPGGAPFSGLSGHETSASAGTAAAETSGSGATPTLSSQGEHLDGGKFVSIVCIVAVMAMVA